MPGSSRRSPERWLPKRGLDWGARNHNTFATAWAFLDRLTHIHVSQRWFGKPHPAFANVEQSF